MTYDAAHRRDTPLARKLKRQIADNGPIAIADYMSACLHDPDHGYYRQATAIGSSGDFVTAPEISQVFGELIGLWCVIVWQQMGAPSDINIIELGPGRGTLMHDALRAAGIVPEFNTAARVHLVETSIPLAASQRDLLKNHAGTITWHNELASVPAGPAIIIANEFLDTFAVDQYVMCSDGWRRRGVGLDDAGALCFALARGEVQTSGPAPGEPLPLDAIREIQDFRALASTLTSLAGKHPLAALFIDYGYAGSPAGEAQSGDTLQAVRNHAHEHPLTSPGEADLTSYVNFTSLQQQFVDAAGQSAASIAFDGPTSQAEFLGALGISERASRLMAANADKAGSIEAGVARLMAAQGMGGRFKVLGLRSAQLPPLPGLPALAGSADP